MAAPKFDAEDDTSGGTAVAAPIDPLVKQPEIPKYCALCVDDDEMVGHCGTGDTPDEAFSEFMQGGEFEEHCAYYIIAPGDDVEVFIYSVVAPEDSGWPEEERNPEWAWCLDKKIDTRTVEAV